MTAADRAALRRRRGAALRLPPLPDGRRDPLDQLDLPVPRVVEWGGYDVITLGLACSHGEDCPARKREAA